jgi:hypothetical protein
MNPYPFLEDANNPPLIVAFEFDWLDNKSFVELFSWTCAHQGFGSVMIRQSSRREWASRLRRETTGLMVDQLHAWRQPSS